MGHSALVREALRARHAFTCSIHRELVEFVDAVRARIERTRQTMPAGNDAAEELRDVDDALDVLVRGLRPVPEHYNKDVPLFGRAVAQEE